jgi:hypothetical protein
MHSLLGAFTIDLLIAVALTVWLVPPILRWLDKKIQKKQYFIFSGVDLRTHKTGLAAIVGSALLGSVSHVLIDVLHHPYNPLTFPFSQYYGFNLVLFNDLTISGIIMQGGTMAALAAMLFLWWLRPARAGERKH